MPSFEHHGAQIYYEEFGQGFPILTFLPVITKDGKQLKLDNEVAYHTNCFACHDAALKARPDLATKISGSDPKGCNKCHVAK